MTAHWRSIPMPPNIARLPRNTAGRPVPRNTPWHEPATSGGQLAVRSSVELGEHVVCPCEPGRGTAAFGDQCPPRQRELMSQRLCGICGRAIKATSRLVFIGGPNATFYIEPPVHPRCAAYALMVCPTLAAAEDVELTIARTYSLRERRMTGVSAEYTLIYDLFPYRDPAARRRGPLDFYLAFPENADRFAAKEWLAGHAPTL
ncbi:hypothetical protein [Streptomyces sp. NPDC056069]|uniref:hypothetical protein n=1 Tax=Streptomyces sp. NPDC056069 TaxID=3345702 RepID=UPI0035D75AFA